MSLFRAGWHVIYTRPRHEKKVYAYLTERNINCFLPTKKTLRAWHDRRKYIDEPLFPSYLFTYLGDIQSYYTGMDAEGALHYVRDGREIARVSDSVIESIRIVSAGATDLEVSAERFVPGRQLVIQEGPLTGLSCEVVESGKGRKMLVRVDLLNRNILLSMYKEQLLAV